MRAGARPRRACAACDSCASGACARPTGTPGCDRAALPFAVVVTVRAALPDSGRDARGAGRRLRCRTSADSLTRSLSALRSRNGEASGERPQAHPRRPARSRRDDVHVGGAHVLVLHTVLPRPDLALELHSTFTGHCGVPTRSMHLVLGSPGHAPVIVTAEHAHELLGPTQPRGCAYEHAHQLIEVLSSLGHRPPCTLRASGRLRRSSRPSSRSSQAVVRVAAALRHSVDGPTRDPGRAAARPLSGQGESVGMIEVDRW
jgi:hypothetical protein